MCVRSEDAHITQANMFIHFGEGFMYCKHRDSGLSKLVEVGFWAKKAYFGPSSSLHSITETFCGKIKLLCVFACVLV